MSYKQERLERQIERELGTILLGETKDQRLRYVTITKVRLNGDYSLATVYYTIMGTEDQIENTKRILEEAKGFLRSTLSKKLKLRKTPELILQYDKSMEYGERIENILKDLKK